MSYRNTPATKAGQPSELQARRWNRFFGQLRIDTKRVDRMGAVEKLPEKATFHGTLGCNFGPKSSRLNNQRIAATLDRHMGRYRRYEEGRYRRHEEVPNFYFNKVTVDSMSPETPSDAEDDAVAYVRPLRALSQRHWQTQEELMSQLLYGTAGLQPRGTGAGVYRSGEGPSTLRSTLPDSSLMPPLTNTNYDRSKPNWIMPEPRRPWQSELPPNWQPLESDERPSLKPDLYSPVKQPLNSFSVSSDIGTGSGCGLCCCCCSSGGGKLGTQPVDVLTTGTERQHCPPASTAAQRLVAHAACCMVTSSSPTEACDVLLIL